MRFENCRLPRLLIWPVRMVCGIGGVAGGTGKGIRLRNNAAAGTPVNPPCRSRTGVQGVRSNVKVFFSPLRISTASGLVDGDR